MFKEDESTVEEVDQSGIRLSPQEAPDFQRLEDYVPNLLKEKESEEVDDDQSKIESDPQEMVEEIVAEVILCDVLGTHTDAELTT